MLSPEWAILPGSRVVEIPADHFGMMEYSNNDLTVVNLVEKSYECDCSETTVKAGLSDKPQLSEKPELSKIPELSDRPGPSDQKKIESVVLAYDLQYWLLRTAEKQTLELGDIVRFSKAAVVRPSGRMTEEREPIFIADGIRNMKSIPVDANANASMEIGADKSVRFFKHATQNAKFSTSFEILRVWEKFAKRGCLKTDLGFSTIMVKMWEVDSNALRTAHVQVNKTINNIP